MLFNININIILNTIFTISKKPNIFNFFQKNLIEAIFLIKFGVFFFKT